MKLFFYKLTNHALINPIHPDHRRGARHRARHRPGPRDGRERRQPDHQGRFSYLVLLMDLFSRCIRGWQAANFLSNDSFPS